MLHKYELEGKPINYSIFRLIEDKIWERHLLGFTWVRLEFIEISPDIIEDLKIRYKVEVHQPAPTKTGYVSELTISWD